MWARIQNLDTNTTPCVLHHNGGDSICRYGLELKRRFFDAIGEPDRHFRFSKNSRLKAMQVYRYPRAAQALRPIPNLSIVTWTSFRFPGSAELSLNHFGVPLDLIHPGGVWSNLRRVGLLRRYLESVDTEYVMVMDSHDTFVTSDIHGVVEAFGKLNCRMLFQAEANDWPPADDLKNFYDRIAPEGAVFPYPCAGIFMGETAFMKRVLARAVEIKPTRPNSDQGVYKQVFAEFHPEIQLDYDCRLFQPLTDYKHPRHPERFAPVDLNLELQSRVDRDSAPNPKALTRGKVTQAIPYWAERAREVVLDRLGR